MPRVNVRLRDGTSRVIDAPEGRSLMEALRDSGIDEVLALCGGCCSCATCHVMFEQSIFDMLEPMGADEDDLLESSPHRCASSRLSCQVAVAALPDGVVVTIAPED